MVCRSELPSPQVAPIELPPPPLQPPPPSADAPELCGELEDAGDHEFSYKGVKTNSICYITAFEIA